MAHYLCHFDNVMTVKKIMKRRGHFLLIQYRFVFAIVLLLHKTHDYFQWPSNKRALYVSCTIYSAVQTENSNPRAEGSSIWPFYFLYVGWKNGKDGTEENILHEVHFFNAAL